MQTTLPSSASSEGLKPLLVQPDDLITSLALVIFGTLGAGLNICRVKLNRSRRSASVIRADEELMIARSVLRCCPAITAN